MNEDSDPDRLPVDPASSRPSTGSPPPDAGASSPNADQPPEVEEPSGSPGGSRRNSAKVGAGILLSRLTGLVRERAIGHFLGVSIAADAFTAAFRVPNMLQHLLGEGVLSASFIPVYSRLLAEDREREAGRVAGAIAGLLTITAGALALVGILFAEPLTSVVAAGFRSRPAVFDLTVRLVRILFPAVGFLVLSAWCLGVLNSHRKFFLSYVAPVVLNVVQVAVLVGAGLTVFDAAAGGPGASPLAVAEAQASLVTWLAVGTVVGGLLQFLVQVPAVLRITRDLRLSARADLPGVRTTLRSFLPVVGARGVVQVSNFAQVFLASFLAAGALAILRYGLILYGLPVALFGMAVAAAELPELSSAEPGPGAAVVATVDDGLARIAALVLPTAVGYLVVGDFIVAALFQTGAFDRLDVVAVWIVLAGSTVGLLASTSSRLLQSTLFGSGDARTPSRLAIVRVTIAVVLGAVLMLQFDRVVLTPDGLEVVGTLPAWRPLPAGVRGATAIEGVVRMGAVGLALAGGIAAWVEYVLLHRAVGREVGRTRLGGGQLGAIAGATAIAGGAAVAMRPVAAGLPPIPAGILAVGTVVVVYVPVAMWLGVDEVVAVVGAVRRRLSRHRPG